MRAQAFRQHDRHLVEHPLGRLLQLRIAQALDQPGAHRDGLDLVDREHQRRQVETLAQHVAHTRRALDRHAAGLQGRHVAIDRAHGDFQLCGELGSRHRLPGRAQDLDNVEQPIGPHVIDLQEGPHS